MNRPRVAIVHDYLNQMGGAERVVGVLHKMFPEAPIYTTIVDQDKLLPELRSASIITTWMQRIPRITSSFKLYFWLYPFAVRSINVKNYDIIVSSSSAYAKGVRKPRGSVHVCYCHAPMRFAWDFDSYMDHTRLPKPLKAIARAFTLPLRRWDKANSKRVDKVIANSNVVKGRIKQYYGLDADVVFPPVDISRFSVADEQPEDYYLIVSRLASYKRLDLAVEACTRLNKKLLIIGDGDDRERLEQLAGPTVSFLGRIGDAEVVSHMQRCKALLFPGLEDFGITPLEANACGRPVIAYRGGGALDTIVPGLNGMYFEAQTTESFAEALDSFDNHIWNAGAIREHAEKFNERLFTEKLLHYVDFTIKERKKDTNC
ncbi:glycosyltransferase [Paenibacillus sp. NPDC058174]|uniref:glycosyltransferase n=1 Tax=Paenibacillus sp. NPDC058174 TaxID=3346366 RepID=UPI0036D90C85